MIEFYNDTNICKDVDITFDAIHKHNDSWRIIPPVPPEDRVCF